MYAVVEDLGGHGLAAAIAVVNAIGDAGRRREGWASIGGLVESQTRGRFQTRTAPDGAPWAAWSPSYASSRHRGQSLLVATGHLRDSIGWELDDQELRVGSNLVYAAIQQAGGQPGMAPGAAAIPAREYLGLSDADAGEILDALEAFAAGPLQ